MKIKIKGEWFKVTLTPIENENKEVLSNDFALNNYMLKNIELFFNENNLLNKRIFRSDYEKFKNQYDNLDILSTKKITLLFAEFAKNNNLKFNSLKNNNIRSILISD
jgi:hypothetical protein